MSISSDSISIKKEDFNLFKVFITFFVIIFLRILLDNFTYPNTGGYFLPIERFIQAPMYFFSIFLSFSISTYFLTKDSFGNIFTFSIGAFLFILIIPPIDFLLRGISIEGLRYVLIYSNEMLGMFFRLMNPMSGQAITIGQYIGASFIFLSLSFLVYKKTKDLRKVFFSFLLNYTVLFFYAILPSIILLFSNTSALKNKSASETYASIISSGWIGNTSDGNGLFNQLFPNTGAIHEIALARTYWLLIILQLVIIFLISNKKIWNGFKNNLRIERIFYWFIIASIGVIISEKTYGNINIANPINLISLLVFLILIVLNIWLAVIINDTEDIEIDSISNPERPLIKKSISEEEWSLMRTILIFLILLGSMTMSRSVVLLLALFQGMYFIYSVGPLKLKRHFITSSIIIGLASIFISMSGFFLVSPDQHILAFPIKAMLIIGLSYALLSNLKDIKDFTGDSHEGIKTIPVVFGLKNSKRIIAMLCSLVMITVPLILGITSLLIPSLIISVFIFHLFTKKEYQEKFIFLTFFLYAFLLFISAR